MRKIFSISKSMILVTFVMLFTMVMAISNVADAAEKGMIYGDNHTLTRAEWMHDLVLMFEMQKDKNLYPDLYYPDLKEDMDYYDDIMTAIGYGVVDLEAGSDFEPEGEVSRDFAVTTLNYCLGFVDNYDSYTFSDDDEVTDKGACQTAIEREWVSLVSGKFAPKQIVTTVEIKKMCQDAQALVDETKVDTSYDNKYTFDDSVIVIPKETEIEIDGNKITIHDASVSIEKNDIFVIYVNDIAVTYTAISVKNASGGIVVTVEESDEGITEIDAQGEVYADADDFIPADGIEYTITEEEITSQNDKAKDNNESYTSDEYIDEDTIDSKLAEKEIKSNRVININELSVPGTGETVKVGIKIYNIKMRYKFDSIHQKALMIASADVKSEIKAKFKSDIPSIRIGYIPFEGIGAIELKAFINVDGEISIGYNNHVEFGVVYEDSMFKLHRTFTNNKQPSLAAAFSVNAGVELLASLDKSIPFISASASVKTGILNKVQIDEYSDNKTPFVCQHRFSFLYATAETSATVDFKVVKKSLVDKKWEIWGPDNTPAKSVMHIEDGQLVPQCTRNPHKYDNFFSKWNSWYGGYGWYGLDDAGEIVPVFTYTLNDEGNATITGYTGRASILDIPEEVDGHPVVAIGKNAFKNRTDLLCVSIPDGVLNIKDDAFYGCTDLSSVNLPKSLVDIGSRVFYNDNNITSIEIPKSLSKAAEYNHDGPFGKCNGLKYISFEEGVSKIAKSLFAGCDGIEEIVIPDTVTTIEDNAFLECEHLLKIKIPSKVTSIGDYAFQGCVSLAEVLFNESLTTIGSRAFAGDSMLREIIITDSVTEIKNGAFAKCDNLNKVVLSKQLKTIGAEAFYNDDKITEIIVPKSLENTTDVIQQYAYRDGFQS